MAQAACVPVAVLVAIVGVLVFKAADERRQEHAALPAPAEEPRAQGIGTTGTIGLAPVAVYDYMEFAGVIGTDVEPAMSPRHDYTADGLRMLAAALEAVAAEHPGAVPAAVLDELRADAHRLQEDPHARDHADIARRAFTAAAEAIGALNPEAGARLQRLAEAIARDRPLLDQREPCARSSVNPRTRSAPSARRDRRHPEAAGCRIWLRTAVRPGEPRGLRLREDLLLAALLLFGQTAVLSRARNLWNDRSNGRSESEGLARCTATHATDSARYFARLAID